MNVIWIVADTWRQDHIGAYGNKGIHTPSLDALAAKSVRFDNYYAASFPTMPSRADFHTGRWTMSFNGVGTAAGRSGNPGSDAGPKRLHDGRGGRHPLLPARRDEF